MLKIVILAVVQGLTEFLPVSSSGHLVIFQEILKVKEHQLAIDVLLHFGTLLSLIVFFWQDILKLSGNFFAAAFNIFNKKSTLRAIWQADSNFRLSAHILIVTLITVIIAVLGKDYFETLFASTKVLALEFFITGVILILTRKFSQAQRTDKEINIKDSIILGLAQSFAIIPAISRSGMTIAALLFRKFKKEEAFRISFLAGMPAILGAFLLEFKQIRLVSQINSLGFVALGLGVSFLVWLGALKILKDITTKSDLSGFGYYCLLVGVMVLLFF